MASSPELPHVWERPTFPRVSAGRTATCAATRCGGKVRCCCCSVRGCRKVRCCTEVWCCCRVRWCSEMRLCLNAGHREERRILRVGEQHLRPLHPARTLGARARNPRHRPISSLLIANSTGRRHPHSTERRARGRSAESHGHAGAGQAQFGIRSQRAPRSSSMPVLTTTRPIRPATPADVSPAGPSSSSRASFLN